jgi:hypothetical protein
LDFPIEYEKAQKFKRTPTKSSLKSKCHPIFLDVTYNSLNTVLENIYSSLKFLSMKFVVYVKELDRAFGPQRTQESHILGG